MESKAAFISIALVLLSAQSDARRTPAQPVQPISAAGDAVCSLPSETGMCRAYIPSYFYNSASGQCETFVYGGCGGNANRFTTPGECLNRCRPGGPSAGAAAAGGADAVPAETRSRTRNPRSPRRQGGSKATVQCPTNSCMMECPNGFSKDRFGCDVCVCAAAKAGPRRRTSATPTTNCTGPQVACTMYCPNGFVKGADGCDTCKCAEEASTDTQRGHKAGFVTHGGRHHHHHGGKPAQIPSNSSAGSPAQIPAGVPAQLPANVPAGGEHPAHLPANVPAQLPASTRGRGGRGRDSPAQLPTVECSARSCRKECPFGNLKDSFGCDLCACRSRPAPGGRAGGRGGSRGGQGDGRGSSRSGQAAQPTFPPHCANKSICRMYCDTGFKAAEDGCPICECNPLQGAVGWPSLVARR